MIQFPSFIVYTKQLTNEAEYALSELIKQKVMRIPYTRVQVKHLSIPQNQTSYNFDNGFTGPLPDLIVVGLLDDADLFGGYQRIPFNFKKLWHKPFGAAPLWNASAPFQLHCQFRQWPIYKRLRDNAKTTGFWQNR